MGLSCMKIDKFDTLNKRYMPARISPPSTGGFRKCWGCGYGGSFPYGERRPARPLTLSSPRETFRTLFSVR